MLDIGAFKYSAEMECYHSAVKVRGRTVELLVSDQKIKDRAILSERANAALRAVSMNWETVLDHITRELLDLKNESWVNDATERVTAATFRDALTLNSIAVKADGSLEMVFEDGDLFWGHAVVVAADAACKPTRIDIEG